MAQPKNRYYCHSCRRPKLLFKTEKSADRFIKFNSEEMIETTGLAPVRSYYCQLCCGWHVTSNSSLELGEKLNKRDSNLIGKIDRQINKKRKVEEIRRITNDYSSRSSALIEKAKHRLEKGKRIAAKNCLQESLNIICGGLERFPQWAKGRELKNRAESLLNTLEIFVSEQPLP